MGPLPCERRWTRECGTPPSGSPAWAPEPDTDADLLDLDRAFLARPPPLKTIVLLACPAPPRVQLFSPSCRAAHSPSNKAARLPSYKAAHSPRASLPQIHRAPSTSALPVTMVSKTLFALAAAQSVSAHFGLTFPAWRADTLAQSADYSQWTYPCKHTSPPALAIEQAREIARRGIQTP